MSESEIKKLVWQTADEILVTGIYPNVDLIAQKLSQDKIEIAAFFEAWKQSHPLEELTNMNKEILDTVLRLANIAANAKLESESNHQLNNNQKIEVEKLPEKNINTEKKQIPNRVDEIAAKADKKAQYMAGGEIVLTEQLYRFYRKTQQFTEAEIKAQVEATMAETEEDWSEDIENFSPAAMLKKFGK